MGNAGLRDDCYLAYVMSCETFYSDVIKPSQHHRSRLAEMTVQAAAEDGGCAWEFTISEWDLGGPTTQVEMFGDSYVAFSEIPEFFAALSEQGPQSLAHVRVILDKLGAVDRTQRLRPGFASHRDELLDDVRKAQDAVAAYDATHGADGAS